MIKFIMGNQNDEFVFKRHTGDEEKDTKMKIKISTKIFPQSIIS